MKKIIIILAILILMPTIYAETKIINSGDYTLYKFSEGKFRLSFRIYNPIEPIEEIEKSLISDVNKYDKPTLEEYSDKLIYYGKIMGSKIAIEMPNEKKEAVLKYPVIYKDFSSISVTTTSTTTTKELVTTTTTKAISSTTIDIGEITTTTIK